MSSDEPMLLFIENIAGAIQFAQSVGGGGSDNDLKWGRDPDEDDRHFGLRYMHQTRIYESKEWSLRLHPDFE